MKKYYYMPKTVIIFLIFSFVLLAGCGTNSDDSDSSKLPPVQGDDIQAVDYSDESNWAKLPKGEATDVDVFCLYPTSYDGSDGYIATINNETMRTGANNFLEDKASAFETSGNIFAPYYRQLDANWFLTLPFEDQSQYLNGTPLTDVYAAFDYYINNYNDGKPFILVGHSQGASMTKSLMEVYFKDNPEVKERMVAAYVIGYFVTAEEIEENDWKFAEGETDTGVIISYNTVSPDTDLSKLTVWHEGALAINPISWTRSDKNAPAFDNLGSYIKVDGEYTKVGTFANARVVAENGVVICDNLNTEKREEYSMPKETEAIFSNESYHSNDIPFYYYNLRKNAEDRVKAFLGR